MSHLKIGQGSVEVENGKTVRDVLSMLKENRDQAKTLGVNHLVQDAIVAEYNGRLVDLSTPVTEDGNLEFFTAQSEQGLDTLRHSASHILAQAVLRIYPGTRLAIGPTIKDGFYYDMELPEAISETDLPKIEEEMQKIVEESLRLERSEKTRQEATAFFEKANQPYKVELIRDMEGVDTVTFYTQGEFTDLCRGPHVPFTRAVKAFKLLSVSGAYWRGSEKNAMLTRIYGTAFADKKALESHLARIEEAKKRDHRRVGKALDMFHIQEEAPGMVFWHDRGWRVYVVIQNYIRNLLRESGYQEVHTPQIVDRTLWEKSGHWEKFREDMFTTTSENRDFAVKPMNCPCHIQIFNQGLRSYRDLPLRLAEFGSCHRNEPSGTLHGLMRVRNFVQDDAHIFCTEEQIQSEVTAFMKLLFKVYGDFGFQDVKLALSTRPEKRVGSDDVWDKAEKALEIALNNSGMSWTLKPGEGAFYGPKIEFTLKDCLDRYWQCGTIQVDFSMPGRLGAEYVDSDGGKKVPVMLHRAILGSIERFIGILIEHHAGKFPTWLAPVQVTVLSVSDKFNDAALALETKFIQAGIRAEADTSNEKLGYKIRKAQMEKIPYMLVLGEQEVASGNVSVRHRDNGDLGSRLADDFIRDILEENRKRL
jgi:threonyl-tRNA synthetase